LFTLQIAQCKLEYTTLQMTKNKAKRSMQLIKQLLIYIKPYRKTAFLLFFVTLLIGILEPSRPYLIKITLDKYVAQHNEMGLLFMCALMIALLLLQILAQYFLSYSSDFLGQHVVQDLRMAVYKHIIHASTNFHTKNAIGRLITRNISDTELIAEAFSQDMAAVVADLLQIIAMAIFMLCINVQIGLLCLATTPLVLVFIYVFKKKIRPVYAAISEATTNMNTFIQSRLTGMSLIQIFGRETTELDKFLKLNGIFTQVKNRANLYTAIYFPSFEIIRAVAIGLLIWYGAKGMLMDITTLGQLTAFLMYIKMLFRPIAHLAEHFNTLQMALGSVGRITELLNNQTKSPNTGNYQPEKLVGSIHFDQVWFAYEKEDYVLKDITFHVPAGTSMAIVGTSGAGKSTIAHLLERFYTPQRGKILLDGKNINDYELYALRKQLGIVSQDVFLFSGSIYDNIVLDDPTITKTQVIAAAQLLGIHELIEGLPGGYEHQVQENGATLSMGQKQFLAFLRVLVYNPRILILDEATSSLDAQIEKLIQKAANKLMKGRTSIVIAHRLSTIQNVDHVLVIQNGSIQKQIETRTWQHPDDYRS